MHQPDIFLFYFRPSSVPYLHTNCTAIIFPNVICVAMLRYYPGLNINASLTPVTKITKVVTKITMQSPKRKYYSDFITFKSVRNSGYS